MNTTTIKSFARNAVAAVGILSLAAPVALADNLDRSFRLYNSTDSALVQVKMSNIHDEDWGIDALGTRVLVPGYNTWVEPVVDNGYCRFDIRVQESDGDVHNLWDINLCTVTAIEIADWEVYIAYTDGSVERLVAGF